ncbi:MAG: hypothetical protein IIU65_06290, partial [Clostridia bacterium]|nr:hypothetical protein [Clostridia bacterium]
GEKKTFQLANGYISTTSILFEKEGVIALISAKGKVEILDKNDSVVETKILPAVTIGKEVYDEVACFVSNGKIILEFPTYEWIDNYPNCDGEHDRWDTKEIGRETISFEL